MVLRIHNTHRPMGQLPDARPPAFLRKPTGLWWSEGTAWRDLLISTPLGQGHTGRKPGAHDYEVILGDRFRLLQLESWDQIRDFSVAYGQPMPHAANGFFWQTGDQRRYDPAQDSELPRRSRCFLIDWPAVTREWDGIEIVNYGAGKATRPRVEWLDIDWAISSGCAWRTKHVEVREVAPAPLDEVFTTPA